MEGSYSKVWNAREEAPAEEYKFFVDSLMGTIRCVQLLTLDIDLIVSKGTKLRAAKRPPMKVYLSRTPLLCSSSAPSRTCSSLLKRYCRFLCPSHLLILFLAALLAD